MTFNAAADILGCLEAALALNHRPLEIVLVDCASTDQTLTLVRGFDSGGVPMRVHPLRRNVGFAGGMNVAFANSEAPFLLTLNADTRPEPSYLSRLLECCDRYPDLRVGAVTGRLLRPTEADGSPVLDACGMQLTLTWRHLDRGSGEKDRGQWMQAARVFGATGAASLFRRQALLDVALDDEVFAEEFHSFREDAELCFRLRERGWEVLYEPAARAVHRRYNLPERRRQMPPQINYHSLKNRYLLRLYHQTWRNLLLTLLPTLFRDLLALGYVLLRERSSLRAYLWLWQRRREILRRRRRIQANRTEPPGSLDLWFLRRELPL